MTAEMEMLVAMMRWNRFALGIAKQNQWFVNE
jgi:hypothetical protein